MTPREQHRRWRPDVRGVVRHLQNKFPEVECITYIDHPWPGWDGRSFDVWEDAQTWRPAPAPLLRRVKAHLMAMPGEPFIRHTILEHELWTSFGGRSLWVSDDHSGRLLHLHVTYW